MSTDKELVLSFLDGNENALKELVLRYMKPVYNFIYHLTGSSDNVEDISQETFVKVWKNLSRYDPEQNFKTWLFTIAKNTAIDWLRKKRNFVFSDFDSDNGTNIIENMTADESPQALEKIILSEDKKQLLEAMEKLPPMYQSILSLRYNEDFTFKEIGEILGKPLHTVKSQHRRALIQLRTKLKNLT